MVKVLVIESLKDDFQKIKQALLNSDTETYQVQQLDSCSLNSLKQFEFNVVLFSQSNSSEENIPLLKKLLSFKLNKPIIYLSNSDEQFIDKQVMMLGVDDCLAKEKCLGEDAISGYHLTRSIQHAIHRKKNEDEFAHLSTHDQLTGLANRYLLYEHLERTINVAKRNNKNLAVLFIDIDRFKLINDSLGHEFGDILLFQTAERLSESVRDTDIVARFGNDEFAILLEDVGSSGNMIQLTEKIQKAMEGAFNIKDHELFVTTSIGVATFPECGTKPETLLKNADSALYKAKELGRNKYHFFTGELSKQAKLKLDLEKNLRRALINGEFDIHLQPQICSHSKKVCGAEALLRWNHPVHGFVSPQVFIPLLDDLMLLPGVESWVLRKVCKVAKNITDRFGAMTFSVNISGGHFKTGNLKENIFLALQSSSLDAQHLEIELTEDVMIEHVEHNNNLLNDLRELGISIALDDFGKGYSSLSYLKNFPADILKIDKAFIDHIVTDQRDAAIVDAMITLSHKLGIKVVAEGVENEKQFSQLEKFNCDYIQGYYFAKPMKIEEFTLFVVTQDKLNHQYESGGLKTNINR